MNCFRCGIEYRSPDLADGKCAQCWAQYASQLESSVLGTVDSLREAHKVDVMALRGEVADLQKSNEALTATSRAIIAGLEAEVRDLKLELKQARQWEPTP